MPTPSYNIYCHQYFGHSEGMIASLSVLQIDNILSLILMRLSGMARAAGHNRKHFCEAPV